MICKNLDKQVRWAMSLALLALLSSKTSAQLWNKKTEITVRERIEVPGAILEPGKYVVKLVDSEANRHIVRFLNEREDHVYSTVIAISNYRLQVTGDTEFAWYERPAGEPPALRAWFYPGDNFGQEFVYPKRQATSIAAAAQEPVPSVADVKEPLMTAQVQPEEAASPALKAAEVQPAEATQATRATQEPTQLAQAREPAPSPAAAAPAPQELPATAGLGALLGLLGMAALGAATMLHIVLQRRHRRS